MVFELSSDDISEIEVPQSITILAGQTSAVFDLSIQDDVILDGTKNVSISVSAPFYGIASESINIHDDESAVIAVDLPEYAREGDGESYQGTVIVNESVGDNVTISLSSDDITEVIVPESVIIPSGQNSAVFNIDVINDWVIDDDQTATISASVDGWTSGEDTLLIIDHGDVDMDGIADDIELSTCTDAYDDDTD
ncbi:MAG: hypothetical protein GY865_10370, partial [candidate division Zixibacteria bacterium]|nr:hypothetical protein [candidate division Zixibacteria bacterium]